MAQLRSSIANKLSRKFRKLVTNSWHRVAPLPQPTYLPNPTPQYVTPFSYTDSTKYGYDNYGPVLVSPLMLEQSVIGSGPLQGVLATLAQLDQDDYVRYTTSYYKEGLARFGNDWRYADIVTVLHGLARLMQPESYLEIGVRRGRSMAMVASQSPSCRIVGFDMWIHNYSAMANPGPEFVRSELQKVGHKGEVELISGDSHKTVKQYFKQHPNTFFDLITVDGDHSRLGGAQDITDVLPHLKVGGIIVFDDISHPAHPELLKVWHRLVVDDKRFSTWQFTELGYGVAFGVRKW